MGFSCGIVGLPNVGKSTLFNAITETQNAEAANYPFCTIEPNIGIVPVPDIRLEKVSDISKSKKIIANQIKIVDIAGLVKGASKGEGLGNKFLSHIREVDAIIHMVRCFEDKNIQHTNNTILPIEDIEIIETELIIADMQTIEKQLTKKNSGGYAKSTLEKLLSDLNNGTLVINSKYRNEVKDLNLITDKPVMYCCNVDENSAKDGNKLVNEVKEYLRKKEIKAPIAIISANIEYEITLLEDLAERLEFLKDIGLEQSGLTTLIQESFRLLQMITFFTSGEKETRAWATKSNSTAPIAAGKIHSDFEKMFIRANVISYKDFIDFGGETACKNQGKMRTEGKEYIVQDGDIIEFLHNA
ncbi:redox-regulated ATPase YchF [Anaplasmataceae bacterium AB001_6]|nr:redox-regulated ATPase YchF [Anaplasmataceae bacterium AB001_6]